MDYKAYTLIGILLASLALVVPIGTIYATTNATGGGATTEEAEVPAINATGGGEEWTTFDLAVGGQTHPIQYMITGGSVENMTINGENQTLGVTINSMSNGTLAVRLPREVIDSKTVEGSDADFAAFIDNAEYEQPGEIEPAQDTRTLLIGFPAGSESIDVIGTSVIPEFSTIAIIVLAAAIVGIIITTARHGRFNIGQRM
ncbi:MAG TPA: PEFG-CTERM sorting domain-containing protein [Nitrososphaera sp.]|jgi:predicted secreted protein with PEFG-CTERM motif|nr:PEFG-CTERM sorting domain-containing protein [Nitrososphaera sp.]